MSCPAITTDTKFGNYERYRPGDPKQQGCASPPYIGRPLFYGKNTSNDTPLFAVLDFEHYKIARSATWIATATALALGIGLAVVLLKRKKTTFI